MKKCECYHGRERTVYDAYTQSPRFVEIDGECWGTPERDICYCKGDKCKCDVYPYIKQKALKEKELKQNAKQKDKKITHVIDILTFCLGSQERDGMVYIPKFMVEKMIEELRNNG